jgi:hypothetical protein
MLTWLLMPIFLLVLLIFIDISYMKKKFKNIENCFMEKTAVRVL